MQSSSLACSADVRPSCTHASTPQIHAGAGLQTCPKPLDKTKVLKDMIFPLCEKLGQTIIFVRTRDSARALHHAVRLSSHVCNPLRGTRVQSLSQLPSFAG